MFQILLAAGIPLGRAAWGGEHEVLPASLRVWSLLAVLILGLGVFVVLARADMVAPGTEARPVRILIWLFAGYFTLNVILNLLSASPVERWTMSPVAAAFATCLFLAARS